MVSQQPKLEGVDMNGLVWLRWVFGSLKGNRGTVGGQAWKCIPKVSIIEGTFSIPT